MMMKAIGVEKYGPPSNLVSRVVTKPGSPQGHDLLIKVQACSVNPIDTKVRNGTYDDAPDYYLSVHYPFHIIGFDGAGIVEEVGPDCHSFKPGDEVFYVSQPIRQGATAEYQWVSEFHVGHKPKSMDFVEAAAMPLTYGTAYESLIERMEIKKGENVGILIINGAGGVGAMASQIARWVLELPVVITTASRPETVEFTKKMGATHVINHRLDLKKQVDDLKLNVPIKYIYITHSTDQHLSACGDIAAPLGKVCSIVQGEARMYGTYFMSKSLSFIWCWLGTRSYWGQAGNFYSNMLEELATYIDSGKIKSHLTRRMKLTLEGIRTGHQLSEEKKLIGKIAFGVDEPGSVEAFT